MTDPKYKKLRLDGCNLAEEYRSGKWDHIAEAKSQPLPSCLAFTDELKIRCPGFSLEEYQRAIANGLYETR
jgi:hypothetical protein